MNVEKYILDCLENCENKTYVRRYVKLLTGYIHNTNDKIEKHHILPKSLFPKFAKDKNNLINLSPRAHFIAHKMLIKIFDTPEMWKALWVMRRSKKELLITGRLYEKLKEKHSEFARSLFFSSNNPMTKLAKLGKTVSSERAKSKTHWNNGEGSANFKVPPWRNFSANELSRKCWSIADIAYEVHKDMNLGPVNLMKHLEIHLGTKLSRKCFENIKKKFNLGWIPKEDPQWVKFKNNYT